MNQNNKVITPEEKTSKAFHIQVLFGTAFIYLTGGVFLSGLAMYMDASDLLVSYISMMTCICGVSILFFSGIIGRFHSFKKITIALMLVSKLATLSLVLIPILVPRNVQIAVFIVLMLIAFTLQAQTTVVLNNWMVTFVDEKKAANTLPKGKPLCFSLLLPFPLEAGGFWMRCRGHISALRFCLR